MGCQNTFRHKISVNSNFLRGRTTSTQISPTYTTENYTTVLCTIDIQLKQTPAFPKRFRMSTQRAQRNKFLGYHVEKDFKRSVTITTIKRVNIFLYDIFIHCCTMLNNLVDFYSINYTKSPLDHEFV